MPDVLSLARKRDRYIGVVASGGVCRRCGVPVIVGESLSTPTISIVSVPPDAITCWRNCRSDRCRIGFAGLPHRWTRQADAHGGWSTTVRASDSSPRDAKCTPPGRVRDHHVGGRRSVIRIEPGEETGGSVRELSPNLLELPPDWWRLARPRDWLFPSHVARGDDSFTPQTWHLSLSTLVYRRFCRPWSASCACRRARDRTPLCGNSAIASESSVPRRAGHRKNWPARRGSTGPTQAGQ